MGSQDQPLAESPAYHASSFVCDDNRCFKAAEVERRYCPDHPRDMPPSTTENLIAEASSPAASFNTKRPAGKDPLSGSARDLLSACEAAEKGFKPLNKAAILRSLQKGKDDAVQNRLDSLEEGFGQAAVMIMSRDMEIAKLQATVRSLSGQVEGVRGAGNSKFKRLGKHAERLNALEFQQQRLMEQSAVQTVAALGGNQAQTFMVDMNDPQQIVATFTVMDSRIRDLEGERSELHGKIKDQRRFRDNLENDRRTLRDDVTRHQALARGQVLKIEELEAEIEDKDELIGHLHDRIDEAERANAKLAKKLRKKAK